MSKIKLQLPRKRKKTFIKKYGIPEYVSNCIISQVLMDGVTDKKQLRSIRNFDKKFKGDLIRLCK